MFATIVLSRNDQWVKRKYGRRLPKGWVVFYTPEKGDDECIDIEFDDKTLRFDGATSATFNLFDTYDYIKEFYDKLKLDQVSYKLTVTTGDKKWKLYEQSRDLVLPPSWQCNYAGSNGSLAQTTTKYTGAKEDQKEALSAIKEYYDSFEGDLTYELKKNKSV